MLNSLKQELANSQIAQFILCILFIVSMMLFTLIISTSDSMFEIIISIIVSLLFSIFLIYKNNFPIKIFEDTTWCTLVTSLAIASISFYFSFSQAPNTFFGGMIGPFSILRGMLSFFLAVFIFIIANWILVHIFNFIQYFYKSLTHKEKIFFLLCSLFGAILIIIFYTITSGFWNSYDQVYSIDSGFVTKEILPNLYYDDIRHVLLNFISLPMYSLSVFINNIFSFLPKLHIVLFNFLNMELLILIGLLLKKITNNFYIQLLYIASAPVWVFSIFLEKYNLSAFFLVLFVYAIYTKRENLKKSSLFLAIGSISTSLFLAPLYFIETNWKKAIKDLLMLASLFIVIVIVCGRIQDLTHFSDKLRETLTYTVDMTLLEKVFSSFDAIYASFIAPAFKIINDGTVFTWASIGETLNILGFLIFIISVIGFISNRNKNYTKIFGYWALFLIVLFTFIGWAPHESPLFSIYFSWAYIPLFVMGIERILVRWPLAKKIVFSSITGIMLIVNFYHLYSISNFLSQHFTGTFNL